jgi:GntR family transcriptional regulator
MPIDLEIDFILSQTDGRPMYQQIMEQIKNQVTLGDWPQGFKLPSIREMAVATKVSVITVKRAYSELESEGVLVTQQGLGSFIAQTDNLSARLKEQEVEKYLNQAIEIARSLGMSKEALQNKMIQLMKLANMIEINQSGENND